MQNRILFLITICLFLVLLFMSSSDTTLFDKKKANINVKDTNTNEITSLELEEYIVGVVAAEMPASFDEEALKAQAIASRTYAVYKMQTSDKEYDVVTDVSNQGYITKKEMEDKWGSDFRKYYEKIKNAVKDTESKVMLYNGEIIEAYYFAMSNGYTEDASLVFSENREYLQSVKSIYENETLKNFKVEKELSKENFCEKLEITCNELVITNIIRSETGRINTISINNINFKGTEIRKLLELRSTDFDIEILKETIKITTRGYGHGVGMSQYGANGMAKAGYTFDEILKFYYKNIKISSI